MSNSVPEPNGVLHLGRSRSQKRGQPKQVPVSGHSWRVCSQRPTCITNCWWTKMGTTKVVHLSAEMFLRAFEKELNANDMPVEKHWRRLLSKSFNDSQSTRFDGQMLQHPNMDWPAIRTKFINKYDTPEQKLRGMELVLHMRQKKGEPVQAYDNKKHLIAFMARSLTKS